MHILENLASGRTLRSVCADDNMPAPSTVCGWALNTKSPFSEQYVRAREIGYLLKADELLDIADDTSTPPRCRAVRLAARQWMLARMLPKVFGDRLQHEHSGGVTVRHENMLDRVALLEKEGKL